MVSSRVRCAILFCVSKLIVCLTWSVRRAIIDSTRHVYTNGSKALVKANVSSVSSLGLELKYHDKYNNFHFDMRIS